MKSPDRIGLTAGLVEEICALVDEIPLPEHYRAIIKTALRDYLRLGEAYAEKSHSIHRLLGMIFGTTEKASNIIPELKKMTRTKKKPKGHGKNGASSYTGCEKVTVPHLSLKKGDRCPGCEKGKVYPVESGVMVRITGSAPLKATSFECEKLRCNLCGDIFTATHNEGPKYDPTASAMVALLRYGTGVPFTRLEHLQNGFGIPMPASTQWDIVEKAASRAHPVYKELIRQAAQGPLLHTDDTTMKILEQAEGERKGTFTTGMLSVGDKTIALFVTGHHHAGENLDTLLAQRRKDLGAPIQMADALSSNMSGEFARLLANCLTHARRNFIEVAESFPEECRHVIRLLAKVYENDAKTKEEKMTPQQRLTYHIAHSGPVMEDLHKWMNAELDEKRTEPNSGLGKAFAYMFRHWGPLTLFLKVPGAPLDNNAVERSLKMAIRHRKNSLFFRTLHGAYIGDVFMSLIQACRLSKVNPFDYLVALQRHTHEVFKNPQSWLPWNYEAAMAALPP
jgi:transposase